MADTPKVEETPIEESPAKRLKVSDMEEEETLPIEESAAECFKVGDMEEEETSKTVREVVPATEKEDKAPTPQEDNVSIESEGIITIRKVEAIASDEEENGIIEHHDMVIATDDGAAKGYYEMSANGWEDPIITKERAELFLMSGNMSHLSDKEDDEAITSLMWILLAREPITLEQLRWAVFLSKVTWDEDEEILTQSLTDCSKSATFISTDEDMAGKLVSWFFDIVQLYEDEKRGEDCLRFRDAAAEKTVREKVQSRMEFHSTRGRPEHLVGLLHNECAKACIRYLNMEEMKVFQRDRDEEDARANRCTCNCSCNSCLGIDEPVDEELFPLLQYAVKYWHIHAEIAEGHGVAQSWIAEALKPNQDLWMEQWHQACQKLELWSPSPNKDTSLIHVATRSRLISLLLAVLDEDPAQVNRRDDEGWGPLWHAAELGNEAVARILLAHKDIDVNAVQGSGFQGQGLTPLVIAITHGQLAVMKLLLAHKDTDLDIKCMYSERTALSYAAESRLEMVIFKPVFDKVFAKGDADINTRDKEGRTPLSHAAGNGRIDIMKFLLSQPGIEADSRDNNGRSVLSHATETFWGDEFVALLLERDDVEPDSRDKDNGSPLSYAAGRGNGPAMKMLLARGAEVDPVGSEGTPLLRAAFKGGHGGVDVVRTLIELGADVNACDGEKHTPLIQAANQGHEDLVELFLDCENINIEAKGGGRFGEDRSALSWAAGKGHESIVRMLLDKGADVECKSRTGTTPLACAIGCAYTTGETTATIELLLSRGADPNAANHYGRTPLSNAAEAGRLEEIKLLLDSGADVNAKDVHSQPALAWAMRCRSRDEEKYGKVVEYLVSNGATIEGCNMSTFNGTFMMVTDRDGKVTVW